MTSRKLETNAFFYQMLVTVAGLGAWLASVLFLTVRHSWTDLIIFISFVPLITVVGLFPNTFTLPTGLKRDKITFTLSDALVFVIACSYGVFPAIFVAGAEGFISSRRSVRRISSNLFSAGMISLAAAAAAVLLQAILRYGFHETGGAKYHSFLAVTIALLPATALHVLLNVGLLTGLFSYRSKTRFLPAWKENLSWATPIALPTSAVASLAYLALQYNWLVMILIGAPILIAINFGHRQYRNNMHQRIELLEKAHRETIEALAVAINAKDEVTHEHVLRVQIYAAGVARLMGCDESEVEALKAGALLHDIGKIAVPDYILNKPGKLTAAEFEQMKMHTVVGAQILGRVDFHYPVVPIVRHHHERWDGAGYPDGLRGEQIPMTARILTVVDCFDALREDRQYRRGLTREEAIQFLLSNSGSQYDPRVVGLFITHLPEFEAEIAAHRSDSVPTFGIEPLEQLSEAALRVAPAAGLAPSEEGTATRLEFNEKQLASFYYLTQALDAAENRDELLTTFFEKIKDTAKYETCAVTLVGNAGEIITEFAVGRNADAIIGRAIGLGEGITGWVIANQKPFCNTDPRLDFPPDLAKAFEKFRTLACFPLLKDDHLQGALTFYASSFAEYSDEQQSVLGEMATILARALSTMSYKPGADDSADPVRKQPRPPSSDETRLESELTH